MNISANVISICDSDNDFADIDKVLLSIQSKSTSARTKLYTESKDDKIDHSS